MKRLLSAILIFTLLLTQPIIGYEQPSTEEAAEILKIVGVFKGSDLGFELDREPTRLEGLIMLLRLLGKEDEALEIEPSASVFSDVPPWGVPYTNYAYTNNLTNGIGINDIGENMFGSNDHLSAQAYATFILRALGYDDKVGDFSYTKAVYFLDEMLNLSINSENFTRGDLANISYEALYLHKTNSDEMLISSLIKTGDIPLEYFQLFNLVPYESTSDSKILIDSNNSSEYLRLTINENIMDVYANHSTANQFALITYDDMDPTFKFQNNTLTVPVSLATISDNEFTFSIYLNSSRYGTYTSWILDYPIIRYYDYFSFASNPIYQRNKVYYSVNNNTDSDNLKEEYQIYPKDEEIINLARTITSGMTETSEKSKAIHEWVAENIYYHLDNPGVINLSNYDHSLNDALTVLYDKRGVCEGYANLTVSLLRSIGIPSRKVSGVAATTIDEFYSSKDVLNIVEDHTWYEVYIDSQWLICDSTWDSKNKIENNIGTYNPHTMQFYDMSLESFSETHSIISYR